VLLGSCASDATTRTATPGPTPGTVGSPDEPEPGGPHDSPDATEPRSVESASDAGAPDECVRDFEVVRLQLDLVDAGRDTPAGVATDPVFGRALATEIWYPETDGPAPLVVFAHGLSGHPDRFENLLGAWAAAGYVVAAPVFPLTNATVPGSAGNWADVANQPADLSFVTDELLAANAEGDGPLAGRIDPDRIGVGGLSLGGATTYLAGLNEATRDRRFSAAMVLAGVAVNDPETGTFLEPSGVPALLVHGDADPVAPLSVAENAYGLLTGPRALVVLTGGGHAEPFQDDQTPFDEEVIEITTRFWDNRLAGRADAAPLTQALLDSTLLTWQADEG
jgi:dienelactone hydrolase